MINKITKIKPAKIPLPTLETHLQSTIPKWKFHQPITTTNNKSSTQHLHRSLRFHTYEDTQAFLTQLSMRAHLWGHHPTIVNTYNRVDVFLTTHDEGMGEITEIDLKFAKRIDNMVKVFVKEEQDQEDSAAKTKDGVDVHSLMTNSVLNNAMEN